MNTTQKHPRHLASPHEVMAALSDAVSDSSGMVCQATVWEEVQLVEMTFPDRGCVVVPPIAFYSVSSNSSTTWHWVKASARARSPSPPSAPRLRATPAKAKPPP
jgi:hypothetical protein